MGQGEKNAAEYFLPAPAESIYVSEYFLLAPQKIKLAAE
ncbi:hypothetical protein FLA_5521 [Filimonas lacunae]|nr:hypothetical protein FLA_5521 [Filimonas lacunae]